MLQNEIVSTDDQYSHA